MTSDTHHMARALGVAERGLGRTSPNPAVGALIVNDEGVIVGRGAHEFAGGPHAEVHAIAEAGDRARGATLYCTLEPCSHSGRTGPCAPLVVAAGIRRAVIAMEDPNPLVSGRGLAHLRAHGVEVTTGVLRGAASRLNRPFLTRMQHGRPFVTMKAALSLDARVAAASGERTRLTGAAANRVIHRERAEVDAIGVGSGTMLTDDPLLTARGVYRYRPLVRVIFDRRLRTPEHARMFSTLAAGPVLVVTSAESAEVQPMRMQALRNAGAELEVIDTGETDAEAFLRATVARLAARGVNSLVVEGGPALHQSLWAAGLVDRVELFVTPRPLGSGGVPWIPLPAASIGDLHEVALRALGEDIVIEGYVHGTD